MNFEMVRAKELFCEIAYISFGFSFSQTNFASIVMEFIKKLVN